MIGTSGAFAVCLHALAEEQAWHEHVLCTALDRVPWAVDLRVDLSSEHTTHLQVPILN